MLDQSQSANEAFAANWAQDVEHVSNSEVRSSLETAVAAYDIGVDPRSLHAHLHGVADDESYPESTGHKKDPAQY